ncbi:MAG: hypothetical protein MRY78_12675 [Saprospiraceae bacterium]|nr:hypothetical protein [Saprospiraceae bacterium]
MTSFRIRPRFQAHSSLSAEELQQAIQQRLESHADCCSGMMVTNHVVLKIPTNQQHFWSPQLSLNFEETDEGTNISGLYGPNPNVWALFTFAYATIGILALFVTITGTSKMSLGRYAYELWSLPVFAIIAVILYIMSQVGQKLGAEETFTLHHFFEEAIGHKVHIH